MPYSLITELNEFMSRTLALLCGCAFSGIVSAACPATDPVATAQWVFKNHQNFYAFKKGSAEYLSPALYGLLKTDWQCQKEGDECAIDGDPWTNAQDGDILQPPTYQLASSAANGAVVDMTYPFGWKGTPEQATQQTTHVSLVKNAASCWVLDDLTVDKNDSLAKTLKDYSGAND